jgi:HEAT repeat protein
MSSDREQIVLKFLEDIHSADYRTRLTAAHNLEQMDEKRAVEPLIGLLDDENIEVRSVAAIGLGRLGDSQAIEPLIKIIHNEDEEVRYSAAKGLSYFDDSRVIAPLLTSLKEDESSSVRFQSALGLLQFNDERVLPALEWLQQNETGVGHQGEKLSDRLIKIIEYYKSQHPEL